MKINFIKEKIVAKKTKETFYAIRLVLQDEKGNVVKKFKQVVFWLTEDEFNSLNLSS